MQRPRRKSVVLVRTLIISSRYPSEYTRNCPPSQRSSRVSTPVAPFCHCLVAFTPSCQLNRPRERTGSIIPKSTVVTQIQRCAYADPRNIISVLLTPTSYRGASGPPVPSPVSTLEESSDFGCVNRLFENPRLSLLYFTPYTSDKHCTYAFYTFL